MNARFSIAVAWLAAGHAVLFGLYWLLLRVPESNLLTLATSAAIAAALLVIAGWIEGSASTMLSAGWAREPLTKGTVAEAVRGGGKSVLPFLGAVVLFAAAWWAFGQAEQALVARRGEIDASLISRFGWTDTAWLHRALAWLVAFLRYGFGLSLALAFFAEARHRPLRTFASRWLRAALSPVRLVKLAVLLLLFFWLPWQIVYWRPGWVRPSWQEAAFVAVKLGLLYLFATVGWAAILRTTAARRLPGTVMPPSAST